jgi:hypothetical protein
MTKPIERVYVCESASNSNEATLLTTDPEQSEEFMRLPFLQKTSRVFVEEQTWNTQRAPDNPRAVLALYASGGRTGSKPRPIVAVFGSEGKWVAEDHNYRRTYLDPGTVLGWRELPQEPDVFELARSPEWR